MPVISCASPCTLQASHAPGLVALSVVIAALASYVALDLAGRTSAARGRARAAWLTGGSLAMGAGIWSMHFVGMLAFRLHAGHGGAMRAVPLAYDVPLVVVSVVAAVAASALALAVVSRPRLGGRGFVLAGGLLALAIAGMHYTGMAAMRMPARLAWRAPVVVASLAVALGTSLVGLWLLTRLGNASSAAERWAKRGAAAVMGLAIAGMHYTGMAAARFAAPDAGPAAGWLPPPVTHAVLATGTLTSAVTAAALVILSAAVLGLALDRRHRARLAATVHRSEVRFRALVERSPECIMLHAGGRVRYVNPAAARLLGTTDSAPLVGRALLDFVHADSRAEVRERLARVAYAAPVGDVVECRVLRADGRVLDVEAVSVPAEHDGEPVLQTHVRDVTRHKELERALSHQAFHDALTGLANRVLFHDRAAHALARASRGGARLVVLLLDLDNFKGVNDGFGHAAGDRVLVEMAARLRALLRASDSCARLGGDEFAVLLEEPAAGTPETHAAHVASRILEALQRPFSCDGADFSAGVSVGIAVAAPGDGVDELLRNADLAMYRAKARGKGRYEVFEPAMHEAVRRRLEIEAELRAAVDGRDGAGLVVHYQPIACIATGAVTGFEALVRWRHPARGLVPPGEFIPVAEETGLILPLGRLVLREAARQAAQWQVGGRPAGDAPLSITVNVSGRQLADPGFVADVAGALAESGLPPAALVLEMTESVLIDDSEATLGRLRALKALGVRLAIDDFGTGFSSLGYLERFPVDLLKIDKRFVDRVGAAAGESPLARAILGLGGALGMRVVAEGIETAAQWERLRELGCEFGQGFFLARPLPAGEAEALLAHPHAHTHAHP